MTKDLSICIHGMEKGTDRKYWVTTDEYMDAVLDNMDMKSVTEAMGA